MDAAGLARLIAVRHKEPGHLRLELPPALCAPAALAHLEAGLLRRAGVYRVAFETEGRRLSIRFEPAQCSLHDVARQLRGSLEDLPQEPTAEATPPPPAPDPLAATRRTIERGAQEINARVRRLIEKLRQPGAAPEGSLQARLQPILKGALTEKATINFLNDVLMFYLIKVHWDLITKRWMKDPVRHADAWLTTFYLVFLLIRYRKTQK